MSGRSVLYIGLLLEYSLTADNSHCNTCSFTSCVTGLDSVCTYYRCIHVLCHLQPGSVALELDTDGSHYASANVSIPNGTYEGQLVIGDSFIYPVKKFTVSKPNDIIVLQFDVEQGKELTGM